MQLIDSHGRIHDYLRLSLTSHCDLRCLYCIPEDGEHPFLDNRWMTAEEIYGIAGIFKQAGINKIRLTGGEPLVRKDIQKIMDYLARLRVPLSMTTNGVRLAEIIDLVEAGFLESINISLDTLRRDRFFAITKRDKFDTVFGNISSLIGMKVKLKLNVVVMRDINDDEVNDFVELTRFWPIEVRFIEFMPFSGNGWGQKKIVGAGELMRLIGQKYSCHKVPDHKHDTARKYQVEGHRGKIAVISTITQPFCSGCNRIRLTADGKMKNCLFSQTEEDLLMPYRAGRDILPLIRRSLRAKAAQTGGQLPFGSEEWEAESLINRSMITIGG
ncbi:GTP 3',8-cyclase MoaA [Olivibacter sitiensis]|uniref:GTP 3',8-cyclase MoaA n=1 Tax=Olivibacter sitiensis TaxID=376470 RepID=UPI000429792D|nr:GTP 3',8-cyclase MoaA [Olivibacter sitiensis]